MLTCSRNCERHDGNHEADGLFVLETGSFCRFLQRAQRQRLAIYHLRPLQLAFFFRSVTLLSRRRILVLP